jgi:imidazolonepropionase-like amidohydrolase
VEPSNPRDKSRVAVSFLLLRYLEKKMRKILSLLLTLQSPVMATAQTAAALAFTHVTVIDMADAEPEPDMNVVIEGNRIVSLGKSARVRPPRNARVIDATGKFQIPGLWDMHVHALRKERVGYFFPLFVANSVTGICDMGTTAEGFAALRQLRRVVFAGHASARALSRRADS